MFEGKVYVPRTGCRWKALSRERFGSVSAIYRRFLERERARFFVDLWMAGIAEYYDLDALPGAGKVFLSAPAGEFSRLMENIQPPLFPIRSYPCDKRCRRLWGM